MRNTVIFYEDWYAVVKELPAEERLGAYDAIMQYAFEGIMPKDKFIKVATALMRSTIDRDNDKYKEKCERNRLNILARWRRGAHDATAEDESLRPNTIATDNDNNNDSDNDNKPTAKAVGEIKNKEKSNTKKKVAIAPARFRKPKVEEVNAYCNERGNYVDAQQFVDFYESKGWKVGNSPMKDWKAAVRTWEQRDGRARKQVPEGVTLGAGEWINNGVRYYGAGRIAPMTAPARPNENSYWSAESQSWVTGV